MVIIIGEGIPTRSCVEANAAILAQCASVSQLEGFVPIVEPEVLLEGSHTIEKAEEVTTETLAVLFEECKKIQVDLAGLILKSSMVLAGNTCLKQSTPEEVAEATLRTFKNSLPKEVAGIVFLSGGQSPQEATENLNEIVRQGKQAWPVTFSFSRALQEPALATWRGKAANVASAQQAFLRRLKLNASALEGAYTKDMEY